MPYHPAANGSAAASFADEDYQALDVGKTSRSSYRTFGQRMAHGQTAYLMHRRCRCHRRCRHCCPLRPRRQRCCRCAVHQLVPFSFACKACLALHSHHTGYPHKALPACLLRAGAMCRSVGGASLTWPQRNVTKHRSSPEPLLPGALWSQTSSSI